MRGTASRRMRLVWAAAALALLPLAGAAGYRALTLEEIWGAADVVILGTVQEVETENREGEPWTRITLDAERWLRQPADDDADDDGGDDENADEEAPADETFAFRLLGGDTGGDGLAVASMPRFEEGERVLLAAYDDEDLYSPIVGFRQGLWRLGPEGLRDERGRRLGLDGETPAREVEGGSLEEILDALQAVLEEAP